MGLETPRAKTSLVLVCYSYPPMVGGSEMEAQRVCSALQRRGHKVQVFCEGLPGMPDSKEWIDPSGVPVRIFGLGLPHPLRGYCFALGVAWNLFRKRKEYDIVHFLMQGLQVATGIPIARLCGKTILMKFSGSWIISRMPESWMGRLELRLLRRWASRVMILNPAMQQEALDVGLQPSKVMRMPNPVDTDEFSPVSESDRAAIRLELGLPPDRPVVLFVGRMVHEKALESLLGAFALVRKTRPQALLALVGDGRDRAALEERSRALGLGDGIRFVGMVSGPTVRKWMQSSDIFALVSWREGLPCSLIEAMAVGMPSVVTDIPASTQLVENGVHGLVAPVRDEEAIAKNLGILMADPELRRRMGTAARDRIVANYSTDTIVSAYEQLFDQVLNRSGKAPLGQRELA